MAFNAVALAVVGVTFLSPSIAHCQRATTYFPGTWIADLASSREALRDSRADHIARVVMQHLLMHESVRMQVSETGAAVFLTENGEESGEWTWSWKLVAEEHSTRGNPILVAQLLGGPTELRLSVEFLADDHVEIRLGSPGVASRWRRQDE